MTNKYYTDAHYTVNNAENIYGILFLLWGVHLQARIVIDDCVKKRSAWTLVTDTWYSDDLFKRHPLRCVTLSVHTGKYCSLNSALPEKWVFALGSTCTPHPFWQHIAIAAHARIVHACS